MAVKTQFGDDADAATVQSAGAKTQFGDDADVQRYGATGSWGGFAEGVKDAVTAPFKPENWKSLTDNPLVNPLRSEFETPDMMTPQNTANSHAESADIQNRVNLARNGHMPVSPYEIGSGVTGAVMTGGPKAILEGGGALIPKPINFAEGDIPVPGVVSRIGSGVRVAAPGVIKGTAKIGAAGALDMATPTGARMVTGFGTFPLIRSGIRDIGSGFRSGVSEFRGPQAGPEVAPKGYTPPYGVFNEYRPPMPPPEPLPNLGPQGMARQSIYTPAAHSPQPINRVSLPEGVNPPAGRQTPVASPPVVLSPSGSFGSGPQSGFSSASVRPATADEIAFENAPRRIVDPLESKIIVPSQPIDTPAAKRAAVTQSRAKFDANGKRNQLK